MIVKVTDEAGSFRMEDLIEHLKKSPYLDECGAVFTFEGIVREWMIRKQRSSC